MSSPLTRRGTTMDFTDLFTGKPPEFIAELLRVMRLVAVRLEPGDATRYELLLTWNGDILVVLQTRDQFQEVVGGAAIRAYKDLPGFAPGTHPPTVVDSRHFETIGNEWTREILATYTNLLLKGLYA